MRVPKVHTPPPLGEAIAAQVPPGLAAWGAAERALGRLDEALEDTAQRRRWLLQARRLDVAQGQAMEGRLVTSMALARRIGDPTWSPGREHRIDQAADVWRALRSATAATTPLAPDAAALRELARRATLSLWRSESAVPDDLFPDGLAGLERLAERWAFLPPGGLLAAGEALRLLYAERAFGRFTGRLARVLAPIVGRRFAGTRHPCLFLGRPLARRRQRLEDALESGPRAWTSVFLEVAREAADRGLALKHDMDLAHQVMTRRCQGSRPTSRLPQAVDFLFEQPVFYAEDLAKALKLSRGGASSIIGQLLEARAIEEITSRQRYRLYSARDVIDARRLS